MSFIVSAVLTLFALIWGYLTYSLPKGLTNLADDQLVGALRQLIGFRDNVDPNDQGARDRRIDTLRGIMLALSDQQLITGVAMLIASFARYQDITVYSMNIVQVLAYFSSTVHLGTIPVLLTFLRRHRIAKGCRVSVMVVTLIMLVFVMILQMSATWSLNRDESDLFVRCALGHFTFYGVDPTDILAGVVIILFLILQYIGQFIALYSKDETQRTRDAVVRWWSMRQGVEKVLSKRERRARKLDQDLTGATAKKKAKGYLLIESFVFHETFEAFAMYILWLIFANVYCITQVFVYRTKSEGTTGPFNTMGFGQVVPLALLALPFFAFLEARYRKWISFFGKSSLKLTHPCRISR